MKGPNVCLDIVSVNWNLLLLSTWEEEKERVFGSLTNNVLFMVAMDKNLVNSEQEAIFSLRRRLVSIVEMYRVDLYFL